MDMQTIWVSDSAEKCIWHMQKKKKNIKWEDVMKPHEIYIHIITGQLFSGSKIKSQSINV